MPHLSEEEVARGAFLREKWLTHGITDLNAKVVYESWLILHERQLLLSAQECLRLQQQVTSLQEASTAELLKHRKTRDALTQKLEYILTVLGHAADWDSKEEWQSDLEKTLNDAACEWGECEGCHTLTEERDALAAALHRFRMVLNLGADCSEDDGPNEHMKLLTALDAVLGDKLTAILAAHDAAVRRKVLEEAARTFEQRNADYVNSQAFAEFGPMTLDSSNVAFQLRHMSEREVKPLSTHQRH